MFVGQTVFETVSALQGSANRVEWQEHFEIRQSLKPSKLIVLEGGI
jgi:hypothetical protein